MILSHNSDNNRLTGITRYFRVSGRVQGVFFRASTRKLADRYGLTGWVRNLPGGDVEGVVSGNDAGVRDFLGWLNKGPDLARVINLEIRECEHQEFDGFEVR